jgi:hypothetical protein
MGNIDSCFRNKKDNEINENLIREVICPTCGVTFLSNYEYNKHIPTCKRLYGDL